MNESNRNIRFCTVSLFLCLVALSASYGAVTPGAIRGTVVVAVTHEPVSNANITVIGTDFGAATDLDGEFHIDGLTPGIYHVQASSLGFTGATKSEVSVQPGKTVTLEFRLEGKVIQGREVVVKSGFFTPSPNLPTSSRSLRYEEIRRAPGSEEDVQRAIQALPGVYSRNDQNNEIIVRGGSPSENLTVIDGIEIDNINHFPDQSTSGGPISAVNNEFLREVTFSTGGFSARYGDRLSSVLDLELREGDEDRFSGQLELSMAGAGANVEGGLPGGGSYLASYRKSFLDLILGPIGLTAIPHYWDAQFKVSRDLSRRTDVSLYALYGNDQISIEAEESDAWSRGAESVDASGYTFAAGARLRTVLGGGFLKTVLARTEAFYSHDVYEVEANSAGNISDKRLFFYNRSTEATDQLHLHWTTKVRRTDEVSLGITLKPLEFSHDQWAEPDTVVYDFNEDEIPDTAVASPEWSVDEETVSLKYGAYAQYRLRMGDRLSIIGGLRLDGFDYSRESTFAPRLSLTWETLPRLKLSLAYGHYYQAHSLIRYTSDPVNRTLPHARATQYVGGLSYLLTDATLLSAEGYYKDYSNLPVSEQALRQKTDPTFRSFRVLTVGTKQAWGIDLFAQQKLATDWYGTLSYSYGHSEFSNSVETFPSDWDFRHVGTLVLGYNFSGKPVRDFQGKWYGIWTNLFPISGDELTISTRYRYVTGRPYTRRTWTRDGPEYDYHWEDDSQENGARYPDYSRWDVRWDSKWYAGNKSVVVFLEVENLLNRGNVAEYIYADDGEVNTAYQFRFFFIGGVRIEW